MNATIDVYRYSEVMSSVEMSAVRTTRPNDALATEDAVTYAGWFACLADPTRVRLLHQVASRPAGITVGELAAAL